MLVPVIGVIQVGSQAHADRYTYLPQIGLCFAITWAVTDLSRSWPRRREILGAGAIMAIAALALSAWHQTSFWRESESLWTHALAVNSNNDVAHSHLGHAALQKGRVDEAILHYQKALEISQNYKETDRREAYYNLGYALLRKDKIDEAIANYRKALEGPFQYEAEAHSSLGEALLRKGQIDEAIVHFEKFVQLRPDHAEAYYNLGNALLQKGRMDDAVAHFEKALKLNPVLAEAENDLGNALFRKGKVEEAIAHYERALQIDPRSISALSQLAWVLATNSEAQIRNGAKAIELAREADQFSGGQNPMILHTLAAAYAETGQFSQAVETAQDALKLAISESNPALADALRQVIGLYQAGKPYHQPQR